MADRPTDHPRLNCGPSPQNFSLLKSYRFIALNFTQILSSPTYPPKIRKFFASRNHYLNNTFIVIRTADIWGHFISVNKHCSLVVYSAVYTTLAQYTRSLAPPSLQLIAKFPALHLCNLQPFSQPLIQTHYVKVHHSQRLAAVTVKPYKIQCFLPHFPYNPVSLNTERVIKSRRMRWAGHMARVVEVRGCIGCCWGNRRERNHWGDLGVDGSIILWWISRRWDVGIWTGLDWPRIGTGGWRLWVR